MVENSAEATSGMLLDIFRKKGIKYGVFDVDGTLLDTHEYYDIYMEKYAASIASLSGRNLDPKEVLESMNGILQALRPTFSVNPALMQETARITALRFGQDFYNAEVQKNTSQLMDLYEGTPPAFEGVYETLALLQDSKLGLVVATHSDEPWTRGKLARNGLLSYFKGGIFTFDTWGQKGVPEWQSVLVSLGVEPGQIIVVGDSIGSDIDPNLILGVPPAQIYRVATDYGDANKGTLNEEVREINKFADLPYAIIEKLS